jgi:hypothetical protein
MASPYVYASVAGIAVGMAVRGMSLLVDRRRQFPTHPHGEIVHLFLGFVAATLGALSVPAILTGNYTAGVFLGLGTSQFHTVRGLESSALHQYDRGDAVPRGPVYAEGIALAFEARNFLILAVALVTCGLSLWLGPRLGAPIGAVAGAWATLRFRPQPIGDLCDVGLVAEGAEPFSDDPAAGAAVLRYRGRGPRADAMLRTPAQRQAILHDLHAALGAELRDGQGHQRLPEARYGPQGDLYVRLWPLVKDPGRIVRVARAIPILEAIAAPLRNPSA